jgi:hypothetical protein
MPEMNPDPGPAKEGNIVILSAESWNALRGMKTPKGIEGQIDVLVPLGGGEPHIGFASEKLVTIIQNGAAVNVFIPIRNA